jgi:hypothetical protein
VETLFLLDIGKPISELFDDFDPVPIGVASLAQVHVGHHRESGKRVAVKVGGMFIVFIVYKCRLGATAATSTLG